MTDFQSLIFYILFFILSTFFIYLGSRKRLPWQLRGLFVVMGILIPTIISGIRGQTVGTDTPEYIRMYSEILGGQFDTPIEPVTMLVAQISGLAGSSTWLFFSIFALISTSFYYLAVSKISGKYAWFMWFLYLFIYFTFSFNIVRQMAAVSILFYAIVQLVSGNKRSFFLWAIIAACTHAISAVAAAIFYIFNKINKSKPLSRNKIVLATIGTAALLGVFAGNIERIVSIIPIPIFQKVLDNANNGEASFSIANGIFYLGVTLLMIVLYRRIRLETKGIAVFAVGLAIGSVLIFLDNYLAHAGRLAYFFVIPALPVILYAMLMQAVRWRRLMLFAVMVMVIALFVLTRYAGDGSDVIPYYMFTAGGTQ